MLGHSWEFPSIQPITAQLDAEFLAWLWGEWAPAKERSERKSRQYDRNEEGEGSVGAREGRKEGPGKRKRDSG